MTTPLIGKVQRLEACRDDWAGRRGRQFWHGRGRQGHPLQQVAGGRHSRRKCRSGPRHGSPRRLEPGCIPSERHEHRFRMPEQLLGSCASSSEAQYRGLTRLTVEDGPLGRRKRDRINRGRNRGSSLVVVTQVFNDRYAVLGFLVDVRRLLGAEWMGGLVVLELQKESR